MKTFSIRNGTHSDIFELVGMLSKFYDDWTFEAKLPINKDSAKRYFEDFLSLDYSITALAIDQQTNKIAGAIGLIFVNNLWHAEPLLYKSFWYAKPDAPGAGVELLKFAKAVAIENGAKQLHIGSMHPRVNKLLERQGFRQQEINYFMEF